MNYCSNCGEEITEKTTFCPSCGKNLKSTNNNHKNNENTTTVIICAIVGFLFPVIGAILYYILRDIDLRAAKAANKCAWISFFLQIVVYMFYGITIFGLLF